MPSLFDLAALLFVAAAAVGFLNERVLHLPRAIGLLFVALCGSLALLAAQHLLPEAGLAERVRAVVERADLGRSLIDGVLGLLLFAGALQVSNADLWQRRWTVLLLTTLGVVVSVLVIGAGLRLCTQIVGIDLPWIWCFVGGAVLAPTDPVAVPQVTRDVALPQTLRATIVGESLLNDGAGVVAFTVLLGAATAGEAIGASDVALRFAHEALGAAVLGLATGWIAFEMIRRVDEFNLEVLLTLALVLGTDALARQLGMSGPIAVVIAGLLIGGRGVRHGMSPTTERNVRIFWSLLDELLNALLFVLIGLELLVVQGRTHAIFAALLAIAVALVGRMAGVLPPSLLLHLRAPNFVGAVAVLTWGGLRGGVSVALALSLPPGPQRDVLLVICYAVVLFTILVQGVTLRRVASYFYGSAAD